MISWTKYIPLHQREAYEKLGWVVDDKLRDTHHGDWSYLGTWKGEGRPPMPPQETELDV